MCALYLFIKAYHLHNFSHYISDYGSRMDQMSVKLSKIEVICKSFHIQVSVGHLFKGH